MYMKTVLPFRVPEIVEPRSVLGLLFRPEDLTEPMSSTVTRIYAALGMLPQIEYLGAMSWALRQGVEISDYVGPAEAGHVRCLWANLLSVLGRCDEALAQLDEALRIHRAEADSAAVARTLYLRGRVRQRLAVDDSLHLTHAIHDLSFAAIFADPDRQPGLFRAAVYALCELIPLGRCLEHDLSMVLKSLTMRFDSSRPGRPAIDASPEITWRRWLRALVLIRFASHRRAENMLRLCRRDFAYQKVLPEYLVVTIDIGGILLAQDRFKELRTLASEAVFRFRSLDEPEARAALLLWRDAALHDDLTEELHLHVRARVAEWMRRDLARRYREDYDGPSFSEPPVEEEVD